MKMKEEHYAVLSAYLETGIMHAGVESIKEHRRQKLGKDIEVRFAWDLWWMATAVDNTATPWLIGALYPYLDDTHITTAMKHFVKNYPAISIKGEV